MMRTKTVEVYEINELSENAVNEAYHNWQLNWDYTYAYDNEQTLKKFTEIFPVEVNKWEYGAYALPYVQWNYSDRRWYYEDFEAIEEMTGLRLRTWIVNNFEDHIEKGKYYSLFSKKEKSDKNDLMGKLKQRRSKVMTERDCVLTGYYMDEVILKPIYDFIDNPDENMTLSDLMSECLNAWVVECNRDVNDLSSKEMFVEECLDNGWEFYEDGSRA